MATVLLSSRFTDQQGGEQVEETWRVTGLTNPELKYRPREARDQLTANEGISRGSQYADPAVTASCLSINTRFQGREKDRCIATVMYGQQTTDLAKSGGQTGNGLLSLSVETYTVESYLDQAGAKMNVQYRSSLGASIVSGEKNAIAQIQRTAWTASLRKSFASPRYADNQIAGQLNNAAFGPAATRQLLFRGVNIDETPEGDYLHDYTFSFNEEQWDFLSFITFGGDVPIDAEETYNPPGNVGGIGRFQIYKEADFTTLPVSFP